MGVGETELVFWFVKVIFMKDEGVWEDVPQESGEGCLAAGGAAGYADYYGLFVDHLEIHKAV